MTTILYAEDQYEVRAMNSAYLQYHGFRVLTAGDGDTALEVARTQRPDLIVLDHSMPRRTGLEVALELQADPSTARIPIVMMTAVTYGAVGRKARDAGCVSFLAKPCLPSRLLEEVVRLTR
jgi:two-component system, cell cycle response regulator DivK